LYVADHGWHLTLDWLACIEAAGSANDGLSTCACPEASASPSSIQAPVE